MAAVSSRTFRKIVIGSAVYDLVVSSPYSNPWTFDLARAQLSAVNQRLGGAALPEFGPFHVLFACMLGSLSLLWSVLRLRDPLPKYGRYDGVGRVLFSTWMAWTLVTTGAPVLWLSLVPELTWAVLQWLPVAPAPPG